MKTTLPAIRRIIREELRRAIIAQAKAIIIESVGQDVLREWNEPGKQQARRAGVGPFVEKPAVQGTQEDPSEMVRSALRLLDDAEKNERVDIAVVTKQLEKVYAALKNSGNTAKSTAWAAGVRQAINLLQQLRSPQVDPRQRKARLQKAQSSIMNLGSNVEID